MTDIALKAAYSVPVNLGTKALLITPMLKNIMDSCFIQQRGNGTASCIVAPIDRQRFYSDLELFGFSDVEEIIENVVSFSFTQTGMTHNFIAVIRANDVVFCV